MGTQTNNMMFVNRFCTNPLNTFFPVMHNLLLTAYDRWRATAKWIKQ